MTVTDRRRTRRLYVVAPVLLAATVACGGGASTAPSVAGVPETVAIGGLPGPLSGVTTPTLPDISIDTPTTTDARRDPIRGVLVDEVLGHRLLLIGDTVLQATSPRAGGIMCDLVTGFGWDVVIEAERGRPVEFAGEVLDEVLELDDWDVVGLMFGHHIPGTVDEFERSLDRALDRLGSRPVILYTAAEVGGDQVAVNRIVRQRRQSRPNVVIVDWAAAVADEPDVLLDDGGPQPTTDGAGRLALLTAAALGSTPDGRPGSCLDPQFTDDSAIIL